MKNIPRAGFFVSALICFLFSVCVAAAQEKTIELKCANFAPPVHPQNLQVVKWIKEIDERTGGRVKIKTFFGGSLLNAPAIYDGVVTGVADIGITLPAYNRGRFPILEGLDLPLGYPNAAVATKVVNDVYRKFNPKELSDTHLLYFHAQGPGVILSNKPVRRLEDLKGLRIRGTGNSAKIAKALGAIPVALPIPETYDALFKGIVDGTITPIEALFSFKLAEVIKYVTGCQEIGSTGLVWAGMNLQKWNSLPKDIQDVFNELNAKYTDISGDTWVKMDEKGRALAVELKKEIFELSPEEASRWKAAVQPLIEEYVKEMEAKGLPGKELIDYAKAQIEKYKP